MNRKTEEEFAKYRQQRLNENNLTKIKIKGTMFNSFKNGYANCFVLCFDLKRKSVILATDNSVFIFEAYLTKTKIRINGLNAKFSDLSMGTYVSFKDNPELKELLEDRKNFSFNEGDEIIANNRRHRIENGQLKQVEVISYVTTSELTKVSLSNGQTYLMNEREFESFKQTHKVPETCPNITPDEDESVKEIRDFSNDYQLIAYMDL